MFLGKELVPFLIMDRELVLKAAVTLKFAVAW